MLYAPGVTNRIWYGAFMLHVDDASPDKFNNALAGWMVGLELLAENAVVPLVP